VTAGSLCPPISSAAAFRAWEADLLVDLLEPDVALRGLALVILCSRRRACSVAFVWDEPAGPRYHPDSQAITSDTRWAAARGDLDSGLGRLALSFARLSVDRGGRALPSPSTPLLRILGVVSRCCGGGNDEEDRHAARAATVEAGDGRHPAPDRRSTGSVVRKTGRCHWLFGYGLNHDSAAADENEDEQCVTAVREERRVRSMCWSSGSRAEEHLTQSVASCFRPSGGLEVAASSPSKAGAAHVPSVLAVVAQATELFEGFVLGRRAMGPWP